MVRRRKRKKYFRVLAPEIFNNIEVGYILGDSKDNILNRTLEVVMSKLTENPLDQFKKCKLKVVKVLDRDAYTIYYGHSYFREYLRSLFTIGSSYVDAIRDIHLDDGFKYRVSAGVFTTRRITTSRKKAIRRNIFKILDEWGGSKSKSFIKAAIYGVLDRDIMKVSRKIYPVRWAGIEKIKVIK